MIYKGRLEFDTALLLNVTFLGCDAVLFQKITGPSSSVISSPRRL
jgi:hypothetical protein